MENTDIPQFHTYRGEIEFEGTLIQADIFIDNKMLEDKNSFLISFLCKSNTIYKMVCRSVLKKEGYYINLKFNGVKLKTRVLSVSQSFIDSNSETYRIGLMCSNGLDIRVSIIILSSSNLLLSFSQKYGIILNFFNELLKDCAI